MSHYVCSLCVLLQLYRLYGCHQIQVSGLVLPAMGKDSDEAATQISKLLVDDEGMIQGASIASLVQLILMLINYLYRRKKKKITTKIKTKQKMVAKRNQNTVVLVTVKWDCSTLMFVISYKALAKDVVTQIAEDVLQTQLIMSLHCTHLSSEHPYASRSFFSLKKRS